MKTLEKTNVEEDESLLKEVDKLSAETVTLTKELVKFRSVNPPGDESDIAEFIFSYLKSLGLKCQKVDTGPRRTNVLATLGEGSPESRSLIFNGHMDVVPVVDLDQWTIDPFDAQVKDGRVIGRGSTDMKGALASCLVAAKSMVNSGLKLRGSMQIHAVADEENGSEYGTRALISKGLVKADGAVVMEGSVFGGRVHARTAVRGLHWIEITTKGRAIHGSQPGIGINAVLKMSKILLALDKYNVRHVPHNLLPPPTLAAGTMIEAGIRPNVIPPYCKAVIDLRVIPGMTEQDNLDQIGSVIQSLAEGDSDIKATARTLFWWPPGEISEQHQLVKVAQDATLRVAGIQLTPRGAPASNDSTFINSLAGVPAMAFGPGDVLTGKAHGADEFVSTEELDRFAKIYSMMTLHYCNGHAR